MQISLVYCKQIKLFCQSLSHSAFFFSENSYKSSIALNLIAVIWLCSFVIIICQACQTQWLTLTFNTFPVEWRRISDWFRVLLSLTHSVLSHSLPPVFFYLLLFASLLFLYLFCKNKSVEDRKNVFDVNTEKNRSISFNCVDDVVCGAVYI